MTVRNSHRGTPANAPPAPRPRGKRGEKALLALQKAQRHEQRAREAGERQDVCTAALERLDARRQRSAGEELLKPSGTLVTGAGEAVAWDPGPDGMTETLQPAVYRAVENPNSVTVEASQRRLDASLRAQVLEPAVDAALSAQASDSIEKMLWHQMAAVHHHAMMHLERSLTARLSPTEQVRYTNAAARLMDVYREGLLGWRRYKSGTTQTVIVQQCARRRPKPNASCGRRTSSRRRARRSRRTTTARFWTPTRRKCRRGLRSSYCS